MDRIKLSETSNSKKAEIVSCLKLCEKLLGGPATIDRLFIVCLSFNFSDPINTFGSDGNAKLEKLLLNLRLLIKLQSNIDDLYDPEILYWHQSLLPFFMKQVIDQNSDQKKIVYVIDATADCANDLKRLEFFIMPKNFHILKFLTLSALFHLKQWNSLMIW